MPLKRVPDLAWQAVGPETVVIDLARGRSLGLNRTAGARLDAARRDGREGDRGRAGDAATGSTRTGRCGTSRLSSRTFAREGSSKRRSPGLRPRRLPVRRRPRPGAHPAGAREARRPGPRVGGARPPNAALPARPRGRGSLGRGEDGRPPGSRGGVRSRRRETAARHPPAAPGGDRPRLARGASSALRARRRLHRDRAARRPLGSAPAARLPAPPRGRSRRGRRRDRFLRPLRRGQVDALGARALPGALRRARGGGPRSADAAGHRLLGGDGTGGAGARGGPARGARRAGEGPGLPPREDRAPARPCAACSASSSFRRSRVPGARRSRWRTGSCGSGPSTAWSGRRPSPPGTVSGTASSAADPGRYRSPCARRRRRRAPAAAYRAARRARSNGRARRRPRYPMRDRGGP